VNLSEKSYARNLTYDYFIPFLKKLFHNLKKIGVLFALCACVWYNCINKGGHMIDEKRKLQAMGRADLADAVESAIQIIERPVDCYSCQHYWEEKSFCCKNDLFMKEDDSCDEFERG